MEQNALVTDSSSFQPSLPSGAEAFGDRAKDWNGGRFADTILRIS